jgi:hypothetical protein
MSPSDPSAENVQDQLRSIAVALTTARGRLDAIASSLPEEEGEEEERGPRLRSIISCILNDSLDPAIRDLLCATEQEPVRQAEATPAARARHEPERETDTPDYGALFERLGEKIPRFVAEAGRQQQEVENLFLDLTSLPSDERPAATAERRFHRLDLVERLLEAAEGSLPDDPRAAEEMAGLAADLASRLPDADEDRGGRSRAACWTAHARRLAGDLGGAERALSEATLLAAFADEQAELSRALALVRWEQGRTDEARALLERAEELWAGEEFPHEQAACQVLQALLTVEEGRGRGAARMLRDGLPLLVDPWLSAYGGLSLALSLAERGQAKQARKQRDQSELLAPLAPAAASLFARRLEARIALALGEHEMAGTLLADLRQEAIERRWLPEAALATLDLARLDYERGREPQEARKRATELAAVFSGPEPLDGVLAALRTYEDQVAEQLAAGASLQDFTASLAATLLRLLRLRDLRGAPLPFT